MTDDQLICTKSLFKDAYQEFAFVVGKSYQVIERSAEPNYIWVKDEQGNSYTFLGANEEDKYMLKLDHYFKAVE